mgnify:CR=1 FL=1
MGRMECKIVIITRREICWYKKQRDFFCLLDFFLKGSNPKIQIHEDKQDSRNSQTPNFRTSVVSVPLAALYPSKIPPVCRTFVEKND